MKTRFVARAVSAGLCALASLCFAQVVQAQIEFQAPAKPVVMIVLDTSASMEWTADPDTYPTCDNPATAQDETPTANVARSRQVIAKEVLAGRYENYDCEVAQRPLGFNDPFPHNIPKGTQRPETGFLYLNRDFVRFGFMSFDGDYRSTETDDPPANTKRVSYPLVNGQSVLPELTNWNIGARGPDAKYGGMVTIGNLSVPGQNQTNANTIQGKVTDFVPSGPTPLAAVFRDLRTYLESEPQLLNDAFKSCRRVEVIVISDGDPTYDDCAPGEPGRTNAFCRPGGQDYPYKTTLEELADLVTSAQIQQEIRVHVVGFNVNSTKTCRGANRVGVGNMACIHQMAMLGGTDSNADPNDPNAPTNRDSTYAYIANDQVELNRQLGLVINNILGGVSSRTKTSSTTRTALRLRKPGLYQFSTAFEIVPGKNLWRGRVERATFQCTLEDQPPTLTVVRFDHALSDNDDQAIYSPLMRLNYTGKPSTAFLTQGGFSAVRINPDAPGELTGVMSQGDLNTTFNANVLPGVDFNYITALMEGRATERASVEMGDVFHADPVISGGPELELELPGYQAFAQHPRVKNRKTTVFIGSNDGMLHAFNAEVTDDSVASGSNSRGDALMWSFMPQAMQKRIYLQKTSRITGVDATPIVRDVRLYRGTAQPGSDVRDPMGIGFQDGRLGYYESWGTVLIGGLRGGGRSYYALDVSSTHDSQGNVRRPLFMWELNNTTEQLHLNNFGSEPDDLLVVADRTPNAPLIGLTYGQPALGTAAFNWRGAQAERAVAILPGGAAVNPGDPNDKTGRAVYVVDVNTGSILRRFTKFSNGMDIDAPVTGAVGVHNDFPGTLIKRAFMGDAKGRLLRLDMSSASPAGWTLGVFHDSGTNSPIYIKPAIATNPEGLLTVVYGTGDVDNLEITAGRNVIVSLNEKPIINNFTGVITGVNALVNWSLDSQDGTLVQGEKLTGTPLIYNSVAYFPTFVPATTACSAGYGRVYGLDYDGIPGSNPRIIGRFSNTNSQFDPNNQTSRLTLATSSRYFNLPAGSIVFGLEIAARPSCTGLIQDNLPGQNQPRQVGRVSSRYVSQPSKLELIIQTGKTDANLGGPGNGSQINAVRFELDRPPSAVFPTSWGGALE